MLTLVSLKQISRYLSIPMAAFRTWSTRKVDISRRNPPNRKKPRSERALIKDFASILIRDPESLRSVKPAKGSQCIQKESVFGGSSHLSTHLPFSLLAFTLKQSMDATAAKAILDRVPIFTTWVIMCYVQCQCCTHIVLLSFNNMGGSSVYLLCSRKLPSSQQI